MSQQPMPSNTYIMKWLVLGFLGFVALFLGFLVFAIITMSPLVEVDESKDQLRLLGGKIIIQDAKVNIALDDLKELSKLEELEDLSTFEDLGFFPFVGSQALQHQNLLEIKFKNGRFDLEFEDTQSLAWQCRVKPNPADKVILNISSEKIALDFEAFAGATCKLKLPAQMATSIVGLNGQVLLEEPLARTDITLTNGRVSVEPDEDHVYNYDIEVKNGVTYKNDSSNAENAIPVKIRVVNGTVL